MCLWSISGVEVMLWLHDDSRLSRQNYIKTLISNVKQPIYKEYSAAQLKGRLDEHMLYHRTEIKHTVCDEERTGGPFCLH